MKYLYNIISVVVLTVAIVFAGNIAETEKKMVSVGLTDVRSINKKIIVALAYSTTQNFMQQNVYGDLKKAYLQKEVAVKLGKAQTLLEKKKAGYRLKVFDAARPRFIQYQMWDLVKGTPQQQYVADPQFGSMHNYAGSVDLTIVDNKGNELDMGTPFDFFGDLAQPQYEDKFLKDGMLSQSQIDNRKLLRSVMVEAGFTPLVNEWWHFDGFPKAVVKQKYEIIE